MALPNPLVIDANARHDADAFRALCELASEGQEGVRGPTHLAVKALLTPGGAVTADPGVYSVRNTAAGAAFENYVGVVKVAEQVAVTPTDSSGPRTDLVVLRVENPYVGGTGTWADPPSATEGPYAHIRVIEGVANPNTQTVKSHNGTWTALTLARITRPANTGIVTQAHITDLRSMIDLTVERLIVINNPAPEPPPVAQQFWTESTPCQNSATVPPTATDWTYFPLAADWKVPVPSWALGVDINIVCNPQVTNHVWGGMRLVIDEGGGTVDSMGCVPADYDFNYKGGPGPERVTHLVGGTGTLGSRHRGKEVRMRLQVKSYDAGAHPGHLAQERGTRVNVILNFKRFPITSDGG